MSPGRVVNPFSRVMEGVGGGVLMSLMAGSGFLQDSSKINFKIKGNSYSSCSEPSGIRSKAMSTPHSGSDNPCNLTNNSL